MTLIDPPKLSERIQIPVTTLAQWRYLGVGPAFLKIGKHVRYDEADVQSWLESQRRATA